ncbi:MAG: WhiB family transcriptional regulator [Actinomycetales bacterium]|uniref:WhiB family transcriptional regulator n=1 Tax=Candidatus Phosphoribacter hodrii TaxID=2953743 RepID=A0A935CEJ0_9MICO|nr:WhiB family transcriptional regulator [Candidatus Phosphoribacter hodrii]
MDQRRPRRTRLGCSTLPTCPILTECGTAADSTKERFGVWAGVDRTQPTSSKRKGAA